PELALQLRLDRVRLEHLKERDHARRANLLRELEEVVRDITADSALPAAIKLQGRLVFLFAKSENACFDYLHELTRLHMRQSMRLDTATPQAIAALRDAQSAGHILLREADELIQEATHQQHPLLLAEAILTRAMIYIVRIVHGRFFQASMGKAVLE